MNVIIQLFVYDLNNCNNLYEKQRKELRLREQKICLFKNCMDPSIKSIHIFVDTEETKEFYSEITKTFQNKVFYRLFGKQPTYKDLLEYAIHTFNNNDLVCIMNSDMYFNSQRDHELIQKIATPKRLISLSRHEITDEAHTICNYETCPFTHYGGSSDVFIFKMPIASNFQLDAVNHKQNLFGAEGVFHKAWVDCGYELVNPCEDIKTMHLHNGRVHFVKYDTIETPDNAVLNLKTKLPQD